MTETGKHAADATGSNDKLFVARQPIFDVYQKLFGYELLYRSSLNNSYDSTNGTSATLNVIRDAFLLLGTQVIGKEKAFINFDLDLLNQKAPLTLRPEITVVEILESVIVNSAVVEFCLELKEAGYTIALDDFTPDNNNAEALVCLADIIKVDFRQSSVAECTAIVRKHTGKNVEFLAEKVETPEEFLKAREMGYQYFQGYFFGKPQIVSTKDIPANKMNCLRMLSEVNRMDVDFRNLEDTIKRDTYLTFTLLSYINSAYFGLRGSASSIGQALALLGEREVRKWASLVIMTLMGSDKPSVVSTTSLVRAKFCECLAMKTDLAQRSSELFMTGMLSMLDVLVGRPISEVLDRINVSKEIKVALTTGENRYGTVLHLVLAYERGAWDEVNTLIGQIGLNGVDIFPEYSTAVQWAEQVFEMGTRTDARHN